MGIPVGVVYSHEQDPSGLPAAARRAEELGFDHFWIVEDCFYMGGISQAAIALASTSSIKVGIGINPAVAHNAAILAMEYSTLARAFPGRLIGGIGHGVPIWMKQIGENVASPLTAIEETTTAMKRLLDGERITVDGRYVKLTDVQLDPPPTEAPPILLGVRQEKSIRLAGRISDGVLMGSNSGVEYIKWTYDLMNEESDSPRTIGVFVHAWVDDKDPEAARDVIRKVVAGAIGNEIAPNTAVLSYSDELKKLIDAGGPDSLYESMPDEWVSDIAVGGSVTQSRASILNAADAGADFVVLSSMPEWDWMQWLEASAAVLD